MLRLKKLCNKFPSSLSGYYRLATLCTLYIHKRSDCCFSDLESQTLSSLLSILSVFLFPERFQEGKEEGRRDHLSPIHFPLPLLLSFSLKTVNPVLIIITRQANSQQLIIRGKKTHPTHSTARSLQSLGVFSSSSLLEVIFSLQVISVPSESHHYRHQKKGRCRCWNRCTNTCCSQSPSS